MSVIIWWVVAGYVGGSIVAFLMMLLLGPYALRCGEYTGIKIVDAPRYSWQENLLPFILPLIGIGIIVLIMWAWLASGIAFFRRRNIL